MGFAHEAFLFLEAEQFDDLGGWDVDQQSMDPMGSAYLLAHGLGVPVKDAVTTTQVPSPGTYRVWIHLQISPGWGRASFLPKKSGDHLVDDRLIRRRMNETYKG